MCCLSSSRPVLILLMLSWRFAGSLWLLRHLLRDLIAARNRLNCHILRLDRIGGFHWLRLPLDLSSLTDSERLHFSQVSVFGQTFTQVQFCWLQTWLLCPQKSAKGKCGALVIECEWTVVYDKVWCVTHCFYFFIVRN